MWKTDPTAASAPAGKTQAEGKSWRHQIGKVITTTFQGGEMTRTFGKVSDRLLGLLVPKSTASAACTNCYGCYNTGSCNCQNNRRWKTRYCKKCVASTCIWEFSMCIADASCA
jgi:hypothetical protein